MNVRIDLKDEKMCTGCPFDCQDKVVCNVGITRTLGELKQDYAYDNRPYIGVYMQRPKECQIANELAAKVIEQIPEYKKKSGIILK
jgi:hypothetical protein